MKKAIVILAICLLMLPSFSVALGEIPNLEENKIKEENEVEPLDTDTYSNCRILVSGQCDTVLGPLVWLLGFYCPLFKRNFIIRASGGETEKLNVIVFGNGNFGTYYDLENIQLDIRSASGILFWYGKSILLEGNRIFAFCNAKTIFINH